MKLVTKTVYASKMGFNTRTVEEPANLSDIQACLAEQGLIVITQERLDIEHDVANLQGWIDGRNAALSMNTDKLVTSKNKLLHGLRKDRRAMIAIAQETGNE